MSTTIADAKNNLPKLIHSAEEGQDIHITRHGQPVAVLISEKRYKQAFGADNNLYASIKKWRETHLKDDFELTDEEIDSWRDRSPAREFSWE